MLKESLMGGRGRLRQGGGTGLWGRERPCRPARSQIGIASSVAQTRPHLSTSGRPFMLAKMRSTATTVPAGWPVRRDRRPRSSQCRGCLRLTAALLSGAGALYGQDRKDAPESETNPNLLTTETFPAASGDTLRVEVSVGGGFVARLSPESK